MTYWFPIYKLSGILLIATSVLSLFQLTLELPNRLQSNFYRLQISKCKLPRSIPLLQSFAITLLLSASPPPLAMKSARAKLMRVRLLFMRVVTLSVLTVDSVAGT